MYTVDGHHWIAKISASSYPPSKRWDQQPFANIAANKFELPDSGA